MTALRFAPPTRFIFHLLALLLLLGIVSPLHAMQVSLAWDANDPVPEGYRLYQREQGGSYDYSAPVWSGTQTGGTVANLADDTTYFFVVRAFSGTAVSGDSNEVTVQTPPPAIVSYTITATAGANGSITPSGSTSVVHGGSQTYTIAADSGYHIANVLVNGVSVGAVSSYTFSQVGANQTISAAFAVNTYTLSATAGANGSITPSGSTSVVHGGSQTYTIAAASGYHIANVLVNGVSVGAVSSYTFSQVSANQTISAGFAINTYTINASAGEGGAIAPAGNLTINSGGSQSFTIHPQTGYEVQALRLDGQSLGALTGYTLHAVNANHTIEAIFARVNPSPVADAGPDQTVEEFQWVTLCGLNSHDPGDGLASYQWHQIQGPPVILETVSGSARKTFLAPDVNVEGAALVFELTVTNAIGATAVDTCIVNVTWVNLPPTAQAGAGQTVSPGDQVVLDATNSVDPDDGIAAYRWAQTSGPAVVLSNASSVKPTFIAPQVGEQGASIRFELTVTDHGGLQATDSCIVTIAGVNAQPTADAGPDQQVKEGRQVSLYGGNSSDPDDGIFSYLWKQTHGHPVVLCDVRASNPSFTAPDVNPEGASLVFRLTVTDRGGLQHDDLCLVNVLWENRSPIAVAGSDQTVTSGAWVQLDATGSSDPDDGIAAYQWSQTGGPTVVLSDPQAVNPTFKAPDVDPAGASLTFNLTVVDFSGLKASDTCVVNVVWLNQPPTADAGADQTARVGDRVTLDGSASWDNDDGIAGYRWRQVNGPPVESPSGANKVVASFNVPQGSEGEVLVFELTVTDHGGLQGVDRCQVVVPTINQPPTADAGADQVARVGDRVTLDGSASRDSDDGIASYRWRQVSGPTVESPSGANQAVAAFTVPMAADGTVFVFELTVTDHAGLQSSDRCQVTVRTLNQPPTANAGPDQIARVGDRVTLDGSASWDSDDGIASYRWRQVSGPSVNSPAGANKAVASFRVPKGSEGTVLVFELTVTDRGGLQSSDRCQVSVRR
jgi:hypothetical protein